MGCKKLNTDFFNFLEVVHSKKSASEEKKRINYYPFGLKHKGYNNVISSNGNSVAQKKGFQDQMLDDELGLNWNTFKYRNYDPSLARFHNIDPLAEDYNYQSPYNFSENRVIDGVELEGLEYVSASDARIEVTSGAKIRYKWQNMNFFARNQNYLANSDPNNWPPGQVGIGNDIGSVQFKSRKVLSTSPQQGPLKVKRIIPKNASGSPDGRYNPNRTTFGGGVKTNSISKGLGIMMAVDFGAQMYEAVGSTADYFAINKQKDLLNDASFDLNNYMSAGLLDEKYNNTKDLSSILNVIFQGVPTEKTGDFSHQIIGLSIYNKYNDNKSQNLLNFYIMLQGHLDSAKKDNEKDKGKCGKSTIINWGNNCN